MQQHLSSKQVQASWQLLVRDCLSLIFSCFIASAALANPDGGQVTAGGATISSPSSNTVLINQSTDKAVIDWRSFNIAPNELTKFQQPGSGSITLNRVDPQQGASNILGSIQANGNVWVVNPSGVFVGSSARIDVGGLVFTTANISNQDFMKGNYHFVQSPNWNGAVINQGNITVADHGLAVLVAPGVENTGVIRANLGRVALAASNEYILDFYGDGLISFGVNSKVLQPAQDQNGHPLDNGVTNSGKIIANGGKVLLAADTADKVVKQSINMSGYIEAKSAIQQKGEIILLGGDANTVSVSGKLNVSGKHHHQVAGTVKILGKNIHLTSKARIKASGHSGGGTIIIGGNPAGVGPLANADFTLIDAGAKLNADALVQGNGGYIVVWGTDAMKFAGTMSARGGKKGGDGGFVETSGHVIDVYGARVNLLASQGKTGTWLLDPTDVIIDNNPTSGIVLGGTTYTPNVVGGAASTLNAGDLGTQLQTANILVVTTNASGTGNGDITLNDPGNQLQTSWGSANTTLTLQADRNITISSNLTLAGTAQGLTLAAGTTVASGSVVINGTINGNITLIASSGATGSVTVGAVLGGTSALTSVTLTGATNLNADIITTGAQTFNNTVTLNGSRSLTGGTITMPAVVLAANTLTVNTSSATSAINGVISGAGGGLTKGGVGTLTLASAVNSYTGQTTINNGVLSVGTLANGGATSSLGATAAATPILLGSATSATLQYTGGTVSTNRQITINGAGGGTIKTTSGAATLTLTGALNGGGNPVTFDVAGTITKSTAAINGIGTSLTKIGAGTLLLSITNIYTGATNINAGTLQLGATNGINSASAVILADVSDATFNLNNFSDTIGSLAGGGTTGGNVTLGSATLTAGSDNSSTTYSGIISGTGRFTKTGSGTLTLQNTNNYSGTTTINGGTVRIGVNNAINSNSAVILANTAGVTFDLNNFNDTIGSLAGGGGTGGNVALGTGTLTAGGNNTTTTFSGLLTGTSTSNFIKTGTGSMTLAGANTGFSGITTVNDGTLRLTNANALGTGDASISVASGATLNMNFATATFGNTSTITLNGTGVGGNGALIGSTNTDTLSNAIMLASDTTIGGTGNLVLNGNITGNATLTKVGTNTITLASTNSYTNGTIINAGTLSVTNANALGTTGNLAINNAAILSLNIAGATLANSNTLTMSDTSSLTSVTTSATLNNAITLTGTSATITATTAATTLSLTNNITNETTSLTFAGSGNTTVSSIIGNGAGTLTKTGSGTLSLTNANTYTGSTAINGGTVSISHTNALGGASGGTISLATGTTLSINLGGNALANNNVINLTGTAAIIDTVTAGNTDTLNNTIIVNASATPTITVSNAAANLALTNNITHDGTTLTFTGSGNISLSGVLSGSGNLTKSGSGTFTLSNANTYTGNTSITAGTLSTTNMSALGDTTGGTITVTAATLSLALGGNTLANNNSLILSGAATLVDNTTSGTTDTLTNQITLTGTGTKNITSSNSTALLLLTGNITNSTATLSFNGAGDITVAGVIGASSGGVTKTGNGSLQFNAANAYTGTTTINGGVLRLGVDNSIHANSAVVLANTAGVTLDLNNFNDTIGSLSGGGTTGGNVTLGTGTLTTGGNNTTTTFSGLLSGSITSQLVKTGTGTMTLARANTGFDGITTVNDGTLRLTNANALGTGDAGISVASGATLNMNFATATFGNTSTITLNGTGVGGNGALIGSRNTDTLSNAIVLASDTTIGGTGNLVLNGNIAGNAILTKVGTNTVTLTSINSYTNGTIINAGTLSVTNANALGTTGNIAINNAAILGINLGGNTLQNANTITITGTGTINNTATANTTNTINNPIVLTGSNATLNSSTANGIFNVAGNIDIGTTNLIVSGGGDTTISGVLGNGSGTLTKNNGGTLNLTNANTAFIGNISITGGEINVTNASGLGGIGGGTITLASGTDLFLDLGGATLANANTISLTGTAAITDNTSAGNTDILNNAITIVSGTPSIATTNANATLVITGNIVNDGTTLTFTGAGDSLATGIISGSGNLTKAGSGTLTLANANTYTGNTSVTSTGTVRVTHAQGLGNNTGGTISVAATSTISFDLSGNTLLNDNTITLTGSADFVDVTSAGTIDTFNNPITLTGGAPTITSTNATAQVIFNGNIINNNANLNIAGNGNTTIAGVLGSGAGDLIKTGNGTLTLNSVNTYTGVTTISGGTLALGIDNAIPLTTTLTNHSELDLNGFSQQVTAIAGTGTVNNSDVTASILTINNSANTTFAGTLTGNLSLVKANSGRLTLSGTNTYTGTTIINSGTLSIGSVNSLPSTSNIVVTSGTTLDFSFNNGTLANANTIIINGIGEGGLGALTMSGNNVTINNAIVLGSSSLIGGNGNGIFTLTQGITGTNADLTVNLTNGGISLPTITLSSSGNLAVTTKGNITQNGAFDIVGTINLNSNGSAINLNSTINSHHHTIDFNSRVNVLNTVTVDAGNADIQFANAVNGSGQTLILQNDTAANGGVTFNGNVTLDNLVTFAQPYSVTFNGSTNNFTNAVTFNNTNGVALNGNFTFNAGLTSTTSTTALNGFVTTNNAPITLGTIILIGTSSLTTNGSHLVMGNISGVKNLTLNTGSTGDIIFNGNSFVDVLTVTNTHNLTNNGTINAASYLENAGNIVNLGFSTLNVTGNTTITANTVIGRINTGSLTLDVQNMNLTGIVGGLSGDAAIPLIQFLNSLRPGAYFWSTVDVALFKSGNNITPEIQYLFPTYYSSNTVNNNNVAISVVGNGILTPTNAAGSGNTLGAGSGRSAGSTASNIADFRALNLVFPSPLFANIASGIPELPNLTLLPTLENLTKDKYFPFAINLITISLALLLLVYLFTTFAKNRLRLQLIFASRKDTSFKLRTSLNQIIGFTELMQTGSFGQLSTRQQEFLQHIMTQSNEIMMYLSSFETSSRIINQAFTENLSFKVRDSLNQIMGFTTLLQSGDVDHISEKQQEVLDNILKGSQDILKLVSVH